MIKTKNLERFYFSKKHLKGETRIVPISEKQRDADYYWKKPTTESHKYMLEFSNIILLSRIYFMKPSAMNISIEISVEENDKYILISNNIQCTENAMKVINVGFIPCKYIKITTHNGKNFSESSNIHCYGLKREYIENRHGKESANILYDKAGEIIY
jgi:predicted nucleic acid-binding Zn finger protein